MKNQLNTKKGKHCYDSININVLKILSKIPQCHLFFSKKENVLLKLKIVNFNEKKNNVENMLRMVSYDKIPKYYNLKINKIYKSSSIN